MPNPFGGALKGAGETVVKPVTDEVGEAIEQGVATATAPVLTPQQKAQQQQQVQQKQIEDRQKARTIKLYFNRLVQQENLEKQSQQQQKQKKLDEEEETKKKKEEIKQIEVVKEQQMENIAVGSKLRRVEAKKGGA